MKDPDHHLSIEEQELMIRKALSKKGLEMLEYHAWLVKTNQSLQQLGSRLISDQSAALMGDTQDEDYKKAHLKLLAQLLFQLNKQPEINEETTRKYQVLLDLEEEKLRSRFEDGSID